MQFFLIIILLFPQMVLAQQPSLCDYFDYPQCTGITKQTRRSSSLSLPSMATASNFNPANIVLDKGFGIESVIQKGDSPSFNIITGTGKTGAALISPSIENSFFSNQVPELEGNLLNREQNNQRYKSGKLNFGLARNLLGKAQNMVSGLVLDGGLMLKRNPSVGKINPGLGFSGRMGPFSFGASFYYDDVMLNLENNVNPYTNQQYSQIFGSNTYQEKFLVENYSLGTKFKGFSFDLAIIKTQYDFYAQNNRVYLYSASYTQGSFMANFSSRQEFSNRLSYQGGNLIEKRKKEEVFYGAQYAVFKKLILGLNYNYYMLSDTTLMATIFF